MVFPKGVEHPLGPLDLTSADHTCDISRSFEVIWGHQRSHDGQNNNFFFAYLIGIRLICAIQKLIIWDILLKILASITLILYDKQ